MVRKSLLLCALAASLLISNKNMAHDYFPINPIKVVGYALGGVLAVKGVYELGKSLDFWGRPNPKSVLKRAEHTYNGMEKYNKFILSRDHDVHLLKDIAQAGVTSRDISYAAQLLETEENNVYGCLDYMGKSYWYTDADRKPLDVLHSNIQIRARDLRGLEAYLELHTAYFNLYNEQKRLFKHYAHERASYEKYAHQHQMLKAELYAAAARTYAHAWGIVDYAQQLNADMCHLIKAIDNCNGSVYQDVESARSLYRILSEIHTLLINDRVFVDTAEQYIGWQEQQRLAQRERERIEYERREAERERARLEAARVAAERERQRVYQIQAGHQYVNGYYNGQADASWQTYEAQQQAKRAKEKAERLERERKIEAQRAEDARNDARRHQQNAEYERAKADRERAEKERLAQERDAENRRKREHEEQQRQESRRQEQEAERRRVAEQQKAARREAERQESIKKRAAEREAREREEAEDRRKRELAEQQRQERKRQEIKAEQEAARREADRKFEEQRYKVFDQFQ